jgi:hypothetical protein
MERKRILLKDYDEEVAIKIRGEELYLIHYSSSTLDHGIWWCGNFQ